MPDLRATHRRIRATLTTEIADMMLKSIKTDARRIPLLPGRGRNTYRPGPGHSEEFGLDPRLIRSGTCDAADPGSLSGIPVPNDTGMSGRHAAEKLEHRSIWGGPSKSCYSYDLAGATVGR